MDHLTDLISTSDIAKILEHIHAIIAVVDRNGTLLAWNPMFAECKRDILSSSNLEDLLPSQDKEWVYIKLGSRTEEHWVAEFPIQGDIPPTLCACLLVPISNDRMIFIAQRIETENALLEVVEKLNRQVRLFQVESEYTKKLARNKQIELESVIAQAAEVAQTDALTILFNRRAIIRELQKEVQRSERYGSKLSVSILDVDHFKSINDTYGHAIGDEVLRQVAHQLREGVREPDIVGRYGGEEFIIVLPNSDSIAAGEQADRICKHMSSTTLQVKEHVVQVTLSIGIAQMRHGEDTWDILLNRADNAMYAAKDKGRSCWVVAK